MTTASVDAESLRVVFLGNDPWSVASLVELWKADRIDVALVITNPPRPAGRGGRLRPTEVADAARELGVPLEEVETLKDPATVERLRAVAPDAAVVVAYGALLPPDVLAVPRLGAVNVHLSLLPRWRGASPVQHAILAGEPVTGITLMLIDEGLDTGPILAQVQVPIEPEEDAQSLGGRLAAIGAGVLEPTLLELAAGRIEPVAQSGLPSFAPKLGPEARRLPWDRPAVDIVRRVRAFAPEPGASTTWRAGGFKILRALAVDGDGGPPGSVLAIEPDGVVIAAGTGAVRALEVAPAGRRHMSAAEWARGARPQPGELFA